MIEFRKYLNSRNLYVVSLHLAVVFLAVEVFILANQNKKMRGGLGALPAEFKLGDAFSLEGVKQHFGEIRVDTTNSQLIFLFTTSCPHCQKGIPVWSAVDSIAKRTSPPLSLVSICLDPAGLTEGFLQRFRIKFSILAPTESKEFIKRNNIASVPKVFIRSKDGKVQRLWTGELFEKGAEEVARIVLQCDDMLDATAKTP